MHHWRITVPNHPSRLDLHRGSDPIIFGLINEFCFAGFEAPPLSKVIYAKPGRKVSALGLKLSYKRSMDKIELGDFGPGRLTVTFELDSEDPLAMTMALLKMQTTTQFTVEEIDPIQDDMLTWETYGRETP